MTTDDKFSMEVPCSRGNMPVLRLYWFLTIIFGALGGSEFFLEKGSRRDLWPYIEKLCLYLK